MTKEMYISDSGIFSPNLCNLKAISQRQLKLDLYHNNNMIGFSRQGFSVALEPVMELALVDQASLKFTKICLPLLPKCWD